MVRVRVGERDGLRFEGQGVRRGHRVMGLRIKD